MSIYHGPGVNFRAKPKRSRKSRPQRFWMMTMPSASNGNDDELARIVKRFKTSLTQLAGRDVELEIEELAVIFALHAELKRRGVRFDAVAEILLTKLREQAFGTSDDPDTDDRDADLEDNNDAEEEPDENDTSDWEPDHEDGDGFYGEDPNAGCDEGAMGGYVMSRGDA